MPSRIEHGGATAGDAVDAVFETVAEALAKDSDNGPVTRQRTKLPENMIRASRRWPREVEVWLPDRFRTAWHDLFAEEATVGFPRQRLSLNHRHTGHRDQDERTRNTP